MSGGRDGRDGRVEESSGLPGHNSILLFYIYNFEYKLRVSKGSS